VECCGQRYATQLLQTINGTPSDVPLLTVGCTRASPASSLARIEKKPHRDRRLGACCGMGIAWWCWSCKDLGTTDSPACRRLRALCRWPRARYACIVRQSVGTFAAPPWNAVGSGGLEGLLIWLRHRGARGCSYRSIRHPAREGPLWGGRYASFCGSHRETNAGAMGKKKWEGGAGEDGVVLVGRGLCSRTLGFSISIASVMR